MGSYGSPDLTQQNIKNENVIYCVDCGSTINKDYKFCPYCGNKKKKSKLWLWILILSLGIPVILINLLLIISFFQTVSEM